MEGEVHVVCEEGGEGHKEKKKRMKDRGGEVGRRKGRRSGD